MAVESEKEHSHHQLLSERNLTLVFLLTTVFFFVELAGSFLSNSLALFADSMHMLQDIFALGISVVAVKLVKRPKDKKQTFGYKRAEVISAFLNGLGLFIISLFIFYEALSRYNTKPEIETQLMFGVSFVGLLVNIFGLYLLQEIQKTNINSKSAFLHVLSDTLGSVGTMVASVLIFFTGQPIFDIIISVIISVLILLSSFRIIGQTLNILMERTPNSIVLTDVENKILEIQGIKNVHDIHSWSVSTDQLNFSCHVEITKESEPCNILNLVTNLLTRDFHITHTTIQVEHEDKFIECGSCK